MRRAKRRTALFPVLLCMSGLASGAGELEDGRFLVDEVVATVNGEPITMSEVERRYLEWRSVFPKDEIVRRLAREKVVRQHASRAGVTVTGDALAAAMRERVERLGGAEAYRSMLARRKISPEQDKEDVRTLLETRMFVDQCLGLLPSDENLRPHLARRIRVRRSEERRFHAQNRDSFRVSGRLQLAMVRVKKGLPQGDDSARSVLEGIRRAAISSPEKAEDAPLLAAAAFVDPRLGGILTAPADGPTGLPEEVQAFALAAPMGVVSPIFETAEEFLLLSKIWQEETRVPDFAEVQPRIRRLLAAQKRRVAETALTFELLLDAAIWPEELLGGGAVDE